MSNQNKNFHDDPFSKEQEEIIKRSFDMFEKKLGITKETPDYLKKSFERKLAALSETPKPFFVRWKGFIASLVTAFSIGLLISRFLMMPTTIPTRGISDERMVNQTPSTYEHVSLQVPNPKDFAFLVLSAALEADMEVEIQQAGGRYALYIKPFKPNSRDQDKVRSLLGIKSELAGAVNATIGLTKK